MSDVAPANPSPEIAAHYDALDEFYREVWGEHVHHGYWVTGWESLEKAKRHLAELIATEAGVQRGQRVLDIGCGYGATARWLAGEKGARVLALTNSPAQAQFCREAPDGVAVETVCADWLSWSASDEALFDAALAIESAEHFTDKPAFLTQAHRHLRPGGRLVIAGWIAGSEPPAPVLARICHSAQMAPLAAESAWREMFARAGFRLVRCQGWTRHIQPTWPRMGLAALGRCLARPRLIWPLLRRWPYALAALRITHAFRKRTLRYTVFTAERL